MLVKLTPSVDVVKAVKIEQPLFPYLLDAKRLKIATP